MSEGLYASESVWFTKPKDLKEVLQEEGMSEEKAKYPYLEKMRKPYEGPPLYDFKPIQALPEQRSKMSEATTRAYQLKSDPSVIVQATQFDPHKYPWQEGIMPWSTAKYRPRDMSWGYIDTPSKREHVWNGDYIVLDRLGKPYPVRPNLFEDAYHPAIVIGLGETERPIMLKWVERNGTECTEGGLSEDELTLRTMKLLMRYLEGDVLKIRIEH